jgi:anthranilate/para-aminobenzoate synthase component I
MEILEGLEPVRRALYTGAIGYVDWRGDADWSIAIRTAQASPHWIRFAAGGGITADSDPDAEYQETLDKAEGIRAALDEVVGPVRLQSVSPAER